MFRRMYNMEVVKKTKCFVKRLTKEESEMHKAHERHKEQFEWVLDDIKGQSDNLDNNPVKSLKMMCWECAKEFLCFNMIACELEDKKILVCDPCYNENIEW